MKKKILLSMICIALSLFLGKFASPIIYNHANANHEDALVEGDNSLTLAEMLAYPELIVKGVVTAEKPTVKRDAGIPNSKVDLSYEVKPVIVDINMVLYGNLQEKQITYLQRPGSKDELKIGDQVVLMLVKTTDGYYWSYNFSDGVWYIKNGIVNSNSNSSAFSTFKGMSTDKFVGNIVNEKRKAEQLKAESK